MQPLTDLLPPLAALAVTALCAAAVHGPVSRLARWYVADLVAGARDVATRRLALLGPARQTALFLAVAGAAWAVMPGPGRWWELVASLPVVAALTVAASTDAVCHRLPNVLLAPAAWWSGGVLLVETCWRALGPATGAHAMAPLAGALGAAAGLGLVTLAAALVPQGLGMGDVKLCALIGLWLGRWHWAVPVVAVVAGLFLAGVVAIALMATRRAHRGTVMAMGPYLVCGALGCWLLAVR